MQTQKTNKLELTEQVVENILPDPSKEIVFWDTRVTGFGVRIYSSGKKTYFLQYRNKNRKNRKIKIGLHGSIRTEFAREQAIKFSQDISAGGDPSMRVVLQDHTHTMADLGEKYLSLHAELAKVAKSLQEDQKLLQNIIFPALEGQQVQHITQQDIEALHKDLKHTPYQANRVMALLSKIFSLAILWGWRNDNPVLGLKKHPEKKLSRELSEEELDRLWQILDNYPAHTTAYILKFLLLTGARKREVLNATWDQFDLEKGVWTKPSSLTKQQKKVHLPLSERAIEVLQCEFSAKA